MNNIFYRASPNTVLICCVHLTKVAHFGISFILSAPIYVQELLTPPKISNSSANTLGLLASIDGFLNSPSSLTSPKELKGLKDFIVSLGKAPSSSPSELIFSTNPKLLILSEFSKILLTKDTSSVPKEFKSLYGIEESKLKNMILEFNLKFLKYTRPFLPPFFRLIAPARWAKQRIVKNPDLKFKDKANF